LATGVILKDPLAATGVAVAGAAAQGMVSDRRDTPDAQPVWNALVKHHRSARDELRGVKVESAGVPDRVWGIPDSPSREVTVSDGELLIDQFLTDSVATEEVRRGSGNARLSAEGRLPGVRSGR